MRNKYINPQMEGAEGTMAVLDCTVALCCTNRAAFCP